MIGLLMISITLWGFGQESAVESLSALEVVLTRTVYRRFFNFFFMILFFYCSFKYIPSLLSSAAISVPDFNQV